MKRIILAAVVVVAMGCVTAPAPECTATSCGVDAQCRRGRCVPLDVDAGPADVQCHADGECAAGRVCRSGGCNVVACSDSCGCDPGEVCAGGACAAEPAQCHVATDCPCGLSCNGFNQGCFNPDGHCAIDSDCAGAEGCNGACRCVGGACVPP